MSVNIIEVNDDFLNKVEYLSGLGMPDKMVPDYYGVEEKEWEKLVKRYPAVKMRMKQGVAKGTASVLSALMQQIKSGNVSATKLYLEAITKLRIDQPAVFDAVNKSAHNNLKLLTRDPIEAARRYQTIMQSKAAPAA